MVHHVERANQLPPGGVHPKTNAFWVVKFNNPNSSTALSTYTHTFNMNTLKALVSCCHNTCLSTIHTVFTACSHTVSFHLYLLYYSAHVVEAIHSPPGQNLTSWKELWTLEGLTRNAGGNLVERNTQTAPGKQRNVINTQNILNLPACVYVHVSS